jgi:hypothetical protein
MLCFFAFAYNLSNMKKRGNPNMIKGKPSINPAGAAAGRSHINKRVIEALQHALDTAHPDGAEGYFLEIAQKKPELFIGMIQKVMPNETAFNVTVSLGDAMRDAQLRIEAYERSMVDITPRVDHGMTLDANPLKVKET